MNLNAPLGPQLSAQRAQSALTSALQSGALRSGQFVSMPQLVELLEFPIAAVREAVKHANSLGLLEVQPKRGVQIMEARPEVIRDCLDFRMMLDQEGARRRIASDADLDLKPLRDAHEKIRDAAMAMPSPNLSAQAIDTDLSLHDYLAKGLNNSVARQAYAINRIRIAVIQNVRPFVLDRIVSAMNEHLSIIDALASRNCSTAIDAIGIHYENTQRWWGVA